MEENNKEIDYKISARAKIEAQRYFFLSFRKRSNIYLFFIRALYSVA